MEISTIKTVLHFKEEIKNDQNLRKMTDQELSDLLITKVWPKLGINSYEGMILSELVKRINRS